MLGRFLQIDWNFGNFDKVIWYFLDTKAKITYIKFHESNYVEHPTLKAKDLTDQINELLNFTLGTRHGRTQKDAGIENTDFSNSSSCGSSINFWAFSFFSFFS